MVWTGTTLPSLFVTKGKFYTHTRMYVYIYICVCIYIYIYTYIHRYQLVVHWLGNKTLGFIKCREFFDL
jgi:hypothetical protein